MSKIALLGDSIIEYMPNNLIGTPEDEIKNYGIENIGIESYRKYCWPEVDHDNVDVYILLIGINNILRPNCDYDDKESVEDIVEKLKKLINEIVSTTSTKLLVQSLYPTNCEQIKSRIKYVNNELSIFCTQIGVDYIDMYSLLEDESGVLRSDYSNDGLHPNNLGYEIITTEINKKINPKQGLELSLKNKN